MNRYTPLSTYELKSLLYHVTEAHLWSLAVATFQDLEYAEALFARGPEDLLEDFLHSLECLRAHPESFGEAPLQAVFDFLRAEYDHLRQHPTATLQQALNQPSDSPMHQKAVALLERPERSRRPWLLWLNKPSATSSQLRLRAHSEWVKNCAWRSDREILSVGDDGKLITWNGNTGATEVTRDLPGLRPLSIAPDGTRVLAQASQRLLLVDAQSGQVLRQCDANCELNSCAWSHDASRLMVGERNGGVCLWDLRSGRLDRIHQGNGVAIECCAWSPDGDYVVWGQGADPLRVWDVRRAKLVGQLGDARWVIKGAVHSWTTFSGHKGGATACTWSLDGRRIATGSGHGFGAHDDDFSVRIWDPSSMTELACLLGHQDRITSLCWSPDGRRLASTSGSVMTPGQDNSIRIWDTASLSVRAVLLGHTNEVVSCAWRPDGTHIASASKDGTVIVWKVEDGDVISVPFSDVIVSNDGSRAALPMQDHTISVIDARTGVERTRLRGHTDKISVCRWSPDDQVLASGSLDRSARLWNIDDGRAIAVFDGHSGDETYTAGGHRVVWGSIADMAWSPDGQLLVTAGSDRKLKVWDRLNLRESRTLLGHTGPVAQCAWSADGKRIVSRGGSFEHIVDNTRLLWDPETGCELGSLPPDDPDCDGLVDAEGLCERKTICSLDASAIVRVDESNWWSSTLEISQVGKPDTWRLRVSTRVDRVFWLLDSRHLLFSTENWIWLLDAAKSETVAGFPARTRIRAMTATEAGRRILAVDEAGTLYILSLEERELDPPAVRMSVRWDRSSQRWDTDHLGQCAYCGRTLRLASLRPLAQCDRCHSMLRPVPARAPEPPRSGQTPLNPQSSTSWLRFVRGLLIHQTEDKTEELRSAFRRIAHLEGDVAVFSARIEDPYGVNTAALNAALWEVGAFALWDDRHLAERCLRTALAHDPRHESATADLACLMAVSAREDEARELSSRLSRRAIKSGVARVSELCSDPAASQRLRSFQFIAPRPTRKKRPK